MFGGWGNWIRAGSLARQPNEGPASETKEQLKMISAAKAVKMQQQLVMILRGAQALVPTMRAVQTQTRFPLRVPSKLLPTPWDSNRNELCYGDSQG